jgi:hypothetical protein
LLSGLKERHPTGFTKKMSVKEVIATAILLVWLSASLNKYDELYGVRMSMRRMDECRKVLTTPI